MKKQLVLLSLIFIFIFFSFSAFAADPVSFTKTGYSSLLALDQKAPNFSKKFQERARELFDFNAFAHLCFFSFEKKMTPEQKQKLTHVFSEVFFTKVFNSQSAILKHKISKPDYKQTGTRGDMIIVTISGPSESGNISVGFYLKEQADKEYKLADIDVDGVLLSRNYQGSFNRMFREKGFDGLYDKIRAKLRTAEQ